MLSRAVRHVVRRGLGLRSLALADGQLGRPAVPPIQNEVFLDYAPGSPERAKLREALKKMRSECPDIPVVVGGKHLGGPAKAQFNPSDHEHKVCTYHDADPETITKACDAALAAKLDWENMSFADRAAIFMKAGDLLATKYRAEVAAAVMLGTGKNVWQAEVDVVEAIDFWKFGPLYMQQIYEMQPPRNSPMIWNQLEYRPLEGFVVAISPFNFVAIGSNLPSTPACVGNVCLWKPSSTAMLSNYLMFKILEEAGLPDGVINFVPGRAISEVAFARPEFAAMHFTGSTEVMNGLWLDIAKNLDHYNTYPRIVGETGGKNFHLVHESADVATVVNSTIRGGFEYQGQKCSATSRCYFPDTIWPEIKDMLVKEVGKIKMGQPEDFEVFMTSVINKDTFTKVKKYIDDAAADPDCEIITGGKCDDSKGWFIEPTIIVTKDPHYVTMETELFAPVITVYVYDAKKWDETLNLVDTTSGYALTGSVFAQDRQKIIEAKNALRNAAGNFYINDKSTGSIVGQQPFGGARQSGTNDKSGSVLNYLRWLSPRAIKENLVPVNGWKYPSMQPEDK